MPGSPDEDDDGPTMPARLDAFVERLRALGAITRPDVADAFTTVRRDRCLTGFYDATGPTSRYLTVPQDHLPSSDVLDAAYADNALVTHLPEAGDEHGVPLSSCSQPSLVARMIEWLDVGPDLRVLEIGAGTGYNAALLAVLGCRVTSVDVSPAVVMEARASLARLAADGVDTSLGTVVHGDGYEGWPDDAPYDRVVVTCAVNGLAPSWTHQLAPRGSILVPIRHGGLSPLILVTSGAADADTAEVAGPTDMDTDTANAAGPGDTATGSTVRGRGLASAGFLPAAGPLGWQDPSSVPPFVRATAVPVTRHRLLPAALSPNALADLCFAAACLDERVTRVHIVGAPQEWGGCGVFDPDTAAAALFTHNDVILAGNPVALDVATALIGRWERLGRPKVTDWTCRFGLAGPPDAPILLAVDWACTAPS